MIQAPELMIGNLVQINSEHQSYKCDGDIFTWSLTAFYSIEKGYDSLAWFDPIPLTEEWLLKCGFEYDYLTDTFRYYNFILNKLFVLMDIDMHVHVKYVHQLQNLYFALTGEELNIEI